MKKKIKDFKIMRIGGYLHKVAEVTDEAGQVIHRVVSPIMIELRPRDIIQIIVGATVLAIPIGLTEETWKLGETLPIMNALILLGVTLVFIAAFVYFNFYRNMLKGHFYSYILRVVSIYIISFLTVAMFLLLIDKFPLGSQIQTGLKRAIIASLPCSMSASISDGLK